MSVALYRKYRPKNFCDVTNQNHIKVALQNEIAGGKVGHAYLFCGPRGTGKTTLARLVAKAVNCLDLRGGGEPCNACANCEDLLNNRALDVVEIDAASHTGVDNVRENIIAGARFAPTKSKFKIFIIDEVHMLSLSAFNALLKILEEPPAHVIFILATTEPHKIPATIISRCQRFDFKKINVAELTARLRFVAGEEGVRVDDKVLAQIARQANGCVRDAESLLEQVLSLGEKDITWDQAELILPRSDYESLLKFFELLLAKNAGEAVRLVNQLINEGADAAQFSDSFIEFCRRVLVFMVTKDEAEFMEELGDETWKRALTAAQGAKVEVVLDILEKFSAARDAYRRGPLPQLALELPAVTVCLSGTPAQSLRVSPKTGAPTASERSLRVPPTAERSNPSPRSDAALSSAQIDDGQADLNAILSSWPRFLHEVQKRNYSYYMALCMGKPLACDSGKLVIGFVFDIQRQKLDTPLAKAVLREVAAAVFSAVLEIEAKLEPSLRLSELGAEQAPAPIISAANKPAADAISAIADEFGGEVV